MTAQEALRSAVRDALGPAARSHGYKGSAPNWRKSSPLGDWAIVNLQSSAWNSSESVKCVLNIGFAPEPWLRWCREDLGEDMPKSVAEHWGLYRQRLHPEGTPEDFDHWWEVVDEKSARRAVADMCDQLDRSGWLVLESMFSREALIERLRESDLGLFTRANLSAVYFARAEALLLMDDGPSEALESLLAIALDGVPIADEHRDHAEHFDAWVRSQAG